jgi:hypothetical protein
MSKWCAICTSERGPFVQRPLGKGNALVTVCAACDEDSPVAYCDDRNAYQAPDAITSPFKAAVDKAYQSIVRGRDRVNVRNLPIATHTSTVQKTANMLLVRIPRQRDDGTWRDLGDARKVLEADDALKGARYVGNDHAYYVFERPDPKFVTQSRQSGIDPLEAIRKFGGDK